MRPLAFAVALLATAIVGTSIASEAQAQTPRKGGTIRLTAPYGSSLTSLDRGPDPATGPDHTPPGETLAPGQHGAHGAGCARVPGLGRHLPISDHVTRL